MKTKILNFLRAAFPFLLTVGLWRLSVPFWNPAGILAIIPIFFCSFVRPVPWFGVFSILMCVVIDYKFETVCFWLAMYCLFYAINGFQSFVDVTHMERDGMPAFVVFFALCVLFQIFTHPTLVNLLRGMWIFAWATTLYLPTTVLIKRIHK